MNARRARRLGAAAALLAIAAVSCGGGSSRAPTPTSWSAEVTSTGCPGGPGALPRSSCRTLLISGPNVPGLKVQLRIIEPDPSQTLRGTVLFGTGGDGDTFYGEQTGADLLFSSLSDLGYRVVDRAWLSRWWAAGHSIRTQSRRYATLLSWVHDNIHTTGTFSASGNSSGAGEIGYALTTWNRARLLDVAVLTSGPPMTRLDYVCASSIPAVWQSRCPTLAPPGVFTCGALTCVLGPTNEGVRLCQALSPNATPAMLHGDSILHPGATTDYGDARVHLVFGTMDCTSGVASGLLFHDEVQSEKVLEFAVNTPHFVPTSAEGRDAITRAILGVSPGAAGPASISAPARPQEDGTMQLQLRGAAGASYHLFLSFDVTSGRELGGLGWWFLRAPVIDLGSGVLPASGQATRTMRLPTDEALRGLRLFDQAVIGSRLSNLASTTILP